MGDTTELVTGNGKLFLAAILDLFSRYVVGWALSPSNDRFLTMKALEMAIHRRCPDAAPMRFRRELIGVRRDNEDAFARVW